MVDIEAWINIVCGTVDITVEVASWPLRAWGLWKRTRRWERGTVFVEEVRVTTRSSTSRDVSQEGLVDVDNILVILERRYDRS